MAGGAGRALERDEELSGSENDPVDRFPARREPVFACAELRFRPHPASQRIGIDHVHDFGLIQSRIIVIWDKSGNGGHNLEKIAKGLEFVQRKI